jgi:mono/diheme cytochrome c family protein
VPSGFPRKAAVGALVAAGLLLAVPAGAAERDAVARGAYLANAADCVGCHTDSEHGGPPYAGRVELKTVLGTIVSPNITPDRETGIGKWRDSDFTAAMRWGIAPDGSHLLTSFPFPFYNRLTGRDLADIKAFLDTVPAVRQFNRSGNPRLFANALSAIAVVATPFHGPWRPDPRREPGWNRGAYLVATVGRCGDCHTPRNWLGAPEANRFLAGTPYGPDGKPVANITSDPETGIGNWTKDDVVVMLTDGQTPDLNYVTGAMARVVKSTAKLSDNDRRAIAVYLKSLPPMRSDRPRLSEKD